MKENKSLEIWNKLYEIFYIIFVIIDYYYAQFTNSSLLNFGKIRVEMWSIKLFKGWCKLVRLGENEKFKMVCSEKLLVWMNNMKAPVLYKWQWAGK